MKYCLNSNQTSEYLKKADEIKLRYEDRHELIDFVEKYPDKTIILTMSGFKGVIAWDDIKRYNTICNGNFIIALDFLYPQVIQECKENNIKFYHNYPITTFWELQLLKNIGVAYAFIDSPLTHQIVDAANIGVPLRMAPNIARYAYIPADNGVIGSWIRPEDLELYEPYLTAIEFEDCDTINKEQALFRIYKEQKGWSGDLGMIITNLNYPGVNRMLPSTLTKRRMNCGQRCANGKSVCQLCYRYLDLANPDKLRSYMHNN